MSLFEIIHISSRGVGGAPERDIRLTISVLFRDYLHLFKGAKLSVFTCIALHSDYEGWANPSLSLMKKETGYTDVGTLSTAVTELSAVRIEGQRVLIVLQKKAKGGRFANNDYLIFPTGEQVAQFEAGTLVRKPRRTLQPNGEKPHSAPNRGLPYTVEPNTVNANISIDSSIHTESTESSIKDSAAVAADGVLSVRDRVEDIRHQRVHLTNQKLRWLLADVIAFGAYNAQKGSSYTGKLGSEIITEFYPADVTLTQIESLVIDTFDMYEWYSQSPHKLDKPARFDTIRKYLRLYRETKNPSDGGNHANSTVLGAGAKPVPPILPKPATAADLPPVRRDGDVPAGRADDRREVR